MSPSSVVMFRLPPVRAYFAGFSRTIASQRDLSSEVPEKSSLRFEPDGVPPPPPLALSRRNQSKSATGEAAAALLKANMPIFAPAGMAAARPTEVHSVPLVEYAPVTLVPSDTMRR